MAPVDLRSSGRLLTAALLLSFSLLASCGGSKSAATPSGSTTTGAPTTTEAPGLKGQPSTIDKVAVGQCVNDVPDPNQRLSAVLALGCEQPHTYEIYQQFRYPVGAAPLPAGSAYPGETVVRKASEAECYAQFPAWMGSAWTESNFDIQTWWPSKVAWNTLNDRKVTCGGYLLSGNRSTGSARGTKR